MSKIQLSDNFGYRRLLRFTLPTMLMVVINSVYSIVDGLFVSNFVGKQAFAAVNFIMPVLMLLAAIGTMLGTGGTALIAKILGQGDKKKANQVFSLLTITVIVMGIIFEIFALIFIKDIAISLGASEILAEECAVYSRIIILTLPLYLLQMFFTPILVAAQKPQMGLTLSIIAGCLNIVLDYLLIVVFHLGIEGAALATTISQSVAGLIPLIYFFTPNTSLLRFCKPKFSWSAIIQSSTNGFSELLSSISSSVVGMLYNYQLMRYIGEDGVAAYGVIMYAGFIFVAIFLGYSMGSAPIVSYNYGAENKKELKNVFHKSLHIILVFGLVMAIGSQIISPLLSKFFVGYDYDLYQLTKRAFHIYSISFLLLGFTIYASSFFTALNNGFISALISFVRTLICETAAVIFIPMLLGISGIWLAINFAESVSLIFSFILLKKYKQRYGY